MGQFEFFHRREREKQSLRRVYAKGKLCVNSASLVLCGKLFKLTHCLKAASMIDLLFSEDNSRNRITGS